MRRQRHQRIWRKVPIGVTARRGRPAREVDMRYRLWALLLGLTLSLSGAALAQGITGPLVHAATGLTFPPEVAGVRMTRWTDYGHSAGRPDLGFSYQYALPGRLLTTVYVYTNNQRVPDGADNPVVAAQFQQAYGDIETVAQQTGRYRDLRRLAEPGPCRVGAITLRCVSFSALRPPGDQPAFLRLMVTGYRAHFVKLRLDWTREADFGDADVERLLQALFGAVIP
jgi:hypothetical protein